LATNIPSKINIKMPMANTPVLAYDHTATITAVKMFTIQAPDARSSTTFELKMFSGLFYQS
jgi:hypothetical protein